MAILFAVGIVLGALALLLLALVAMSPRRRLPSASDGRRCQNNLARSAFREKHNHLAFQSVIVMSGRRLTCSHYQDNCPCGAASGWADASNQGARAFLAPSSRVNWVAFAKAAFIKFR